ncbi:MAG: hypothetical protein ABFD94_11515, partial [Armatimonadia bacterium]
DRPTRSHEYIFLLSKSRAYYYDAEAIMEPVSPNTHARISQDLANQIGSFRANGGGKTNGPMKAVVRGSTRKMAEAGSGIKHNDSFETAMALTVSKRNKRTIWTIPSAAFKGAHFATFPSALLAWHMSARLASVPSHVCPRPDQRMRLWPGSLGSASGRAARGGLAHRWRGIVSLGALL